jgi:ABC-type polysaccharide/polyol phosphate transport system ATPase subunit
MISVEVQELRATLRVEHRPTRSLREAAVDALHRRVRAISWLDALCRVSFEARSGELVAVLGPNGAGKTTLLRVLAGIVPPASGRVRVEGRIAPLIDLGAGFDPELTGDENVALYGSILGMTRAELRRRRDEIFEFAGLDSVGDVPVKAYSAGMIARLGFAVATCVPPGVLLVDEVLAVGDEGFRRRCFERIAALKSVGTAIVLVTHDLGLAEAWANRALHLDAGRQVAFGAVGGVVAEYRARSDA